MSEKLIQNIKQLIREFSESVKQFEDTRAEFIKCFRDILMLLLNAPYKPKYDDVYLATISSWATGPGNVYGDRLELRMAKGKLQIQHVSTYYMTASQSWWVEAEDEKAVDLAVKVLNESEYFEPEFERIVAEIAESLERRSKYFKNRNKKLMKKVEMLRKILA